MDDGKYLYDQSYRYHNCPGNISSPLDMLFESKTRLGNSNMSKQTSFEFLLEYCIALLVTSFFGDY